MESCRNVEVKGRVRDRAATLSAAAAASDLGRAVSVLHQRDSYYGASRGRLKLRRQRDDAGALRLQLVQYDRPDESGAKLSSYSICELEPERADDLHAVLGRALGHRADVVKTRSLFLAGQTRIHVDEVEGLGDHFELEVTLRPHETPEEGRRIADGLLVRLGIAEGDLLPGSYVDLLLKNA